MINIWLELEANLRLCRLGKRHRWFQAVSLPTVVEEQVSLTETFGPIPFFFSGSFSKNKSRIPKKRTHVECCCRTAVQKMGSHSWASYRWSSHRLCRHTHQRGPAPNQFDQQFCKYEPNIEPWSEIVSRMFRPLQELVLAWMAFLWREES